jgi:DNA-binding transcriptional MocR family regulator
MSESHLPVRRIGSHELAGLLQGWRDDQFGAPGYVALSARLRTLVLDGRLPVHTVLPSERALALLIGASRTLTTAAYGQLREDGFAESRHGSGTWTALPHAGEDASWPPVSTGAVAEGDLSTAAPEAPPELHAALVAALLDLPRLLPGHGYVPAGLPELRAAVALIKFQRSGRI